MPPNPQQFAIADLFWVLVFVAVVLAIAMPFLRMLTPAFLNSIIAVVSFQLIAILLMVGFVSRRRKRMLDTSGKLIGVGSSSESQSRNWDAFIAFFGIFFSVVMQLYLLLMLSSAISSKLWQSPYIKALFYAPFWNPFLLMNNVRYLRWRIGSSAVEFFENGIAMRDKLNAWDNVELRRSTFYPNRLMVVNRQLQSSRMVWVDKAQIDHLLAFADAKRIAKVKLDLSL